MKKSASAILSAAVLSCAALCAFGDPIVIGTQVPGSDHSSEPCTPKQHTGDYQTQHFNADISGSQGKEFDVVLFGDSITDFWNNPSLALDGDPINYAAAFNMGIGSERVQNILWRLRNGALDGYTTKYFTLMVGINNGHQKCIDHNEHADRAEDVAESIRLMLCEMATKHPDAKILLMPILPYSFDSKYFEAAEVTAMSEAVNDYILQFVDNKRVFWVDLRSQYLQQNSMPDKVCYREGGHGGYDAVGLCLHPEFFTYSDFWKPALTNAMHKYLSVPAGQAHVADPSLGYAKAAPNADGAGSATITVFGINLGTDANANAVTSYAIDYELDGGAKTRALSNQTGVRKSFVIPNVALGAHTCKVTVTTADNKELVTLLDFEMTEPWSAEPLPADASAVRTDGTLKYAYACGSYTLNGVTFAAAGNNNANISNDIVWPYSQTSGSTPPSTAASGNYYDLLGHCWWATQGDKKVTLKDLTPGHVYLVQIFGYRNYSGHDRSHVWIKESYWDSNYMKVLGDGWTYGGALTGTLTATEATKTFTIMSDGNYAINGIQVRDLGESGVPVVVQPKVGSVTVTTNETAATVFLSGIVLGTDDAGESANSYSVSYKLGDETPVVALSGQAGASAQFTISDLADGEYTCAVTITTDAGKTSAAKSVSFRIGEPPAPVVAPSIGSVSVSTNGTTATISLSGIEMGTDDGGVAATSYSVFYSLTNAPGVAALEGQTAATASFGISDLADGVYSCAVTIMTDKNKTSAAKSVNFRIGEPPPMPVGWTSEPMDAAGAKFSTEGTLVYAYATQAQTVNGVAFTRALPLASTDSIAFTPAATGFDGGLMNEGVSDSGYGLILGNGWTWTDSSTDTKSVTLTLKNLTPGERYLVQILSHTHWSGSMLVSANGCEAQHVYGSDETSGKYGALMTGIFTASAETQDVEILFSGSSGDRPINAVQVRNLGEGGGGEDPIDPVDPTTPLCTLTIPAKTGLQLQSVTTNGVAVAAVGGSYSIVSNTQVTVTFAAASGYEITGGNPVVFALSGDKTFADGEYPVVQAQGGGDPGPMPGDGWTASPMSASSASIRTDGTIKYAYAAGNYTVNGVAFTASSALISNADCVVWENTGGALGFGSSAPSDTESGDYKSLLEHGWWANGKARKIELKNLEGGKRYLVQIIGFRQNFTTQTATAPDGTQTIKFDGEGWEHGGSLVGVFTASGTSQEFSIVYAGQSCINAIQVRELPADAPVEPDAPVIGGEGVDVPFAVSSDKVAITISNAASGLTYGYKKSVTLAGLKDASVVWFDDPAESDGVLTLDIPKDASEPSCFYQIVVE